MADDAEDDEDGEEEGDKKEQLPDMSRNPFAVIKEGETGSELNIKDPKTTLRNWFQKEGFDEPEYQTDETGYAKFRCTLELPVDDEATGRPLVAEAEVSGKKKEAVAACAMEACRLLDKAGVFRSQHSSHEDINQLRVKRLKEDEFYAEDEDSYFDRTGTLETKRKKRMKMLNVETDEKSETFETLSARSGELRTEIDSLKSRLSKAQDALKANSEESVDLDAFMDALKDNADAGSKEAISKLKMQLLTLQKEKVKVDRLVELTRPTNMPELVKPTSKSDSSRPKVTIGKMFGSKPVAVLAKPSTDHSEPQKPVSVATIPKPTAFDEEEDEELVIKKTKLQSLEQLKKDIEEEKSRPTVEPVKAKAKDKAGKGRKAPAQPTTASIVQKVIASESAPKSYTQMASEDEKYQTWVPPKNQTGDGRTSLNEKLGY